MYKSMNNLPITIPLAKEALYAIASAAQRMPRSSKALWQSRLSHVYGDMSGQRAVGIKEIAQTIRMPENVVSQYEILISLETYFSLICEILAVSSLQLNPNDYLQKLAAKPLDDFASDIDGIMSGVLLEELGVYGAKHAFDYSWLISSAVETDIKKLQSTIEALSYIWENGRLQIEGLDPLQKIHHSLFPKNLLHITGQFYTPPWLAEQLLMDIQWSPGKTLVDPFCGSGVFLTTALDQARRAGKDIQETIVQLCGIDLNPTACVAARSNLVLYCSKHLGKITKPLHLNILCADSIAPSIVKGIQKEQPLAVTLPSINIDGENIELPDFSKQSVRRDVKAALVQYGLPLSCWIKIEPQTTSESDSEEKIHCPSSRDRRIWEQFAVFCIQQADMVTTNPPWVGWEYISRPYRSKIQPAWFAYDLFKARGLDAAFLKEDLSSLALVSAWDLYLKDGGESVVVLRPSVMRSDLSAQGLRRLSITDDNTPLALQQVREFEKIRVFEEASTETATWQLIKGKSTTFPVKVKRWSRSTSRWHPTSSDNLKDVLLHVRETVENTIRINPKDVGSRWITLPDKAMSGLSSIQGSNNYTPRMGVFTGGANAVFYVRSIDIHERQNTGLFENITARAKRKVPTVQVELENELIFTVLRGRDIKMWDYSPEVFLICPHNSDTKMYPMHEQELQKRFPLIYDYLSSMKPTLQERKGFAGWEKKIHAENFHTLQRIGDYTFSKFKVCWKYIASEFTVCVISGDSEGKPILPNDKVMFVPFDDRDSAYFFGGLLSSKLLRSYINSMISNRQISTNTLKSLFLPDFDSNNSIHRNISNCCRSGHEAMAMRNLSEAQSAREELETYVREIYAK